MEKYTIKSNLNSCKILFFFVFLQKRNKMLYSIITINFNNCDGLRRTIESVVNQTNADYEYIVIDGGSTDGSVDVIQKYSDRISYWVSEKDDGIYNAMNKGVRHAHGDYCLFLNSGDSFYDKHVLNKNLLSDNKSDIVVGRLVSDSDGRELFSPPSDDISMYYFYTSTLPHQASFIKTKLLKQYPYDESLKIVSDWKFFVETIIFHHCKVGFIDVPIAKFDMTGISTSNASKTWDEKMKVLRQMFPDRVLEDYKRMKDSECLTQTLTPQLRVNYRLDRYIFSIVRILLKLRKK
ncbi:glycosyltransferase [Prevotella brevis]|uniref:Glycosyltransferase n=1 Tax=Xylanibacter brevis TaxID=83231 RepID=A0ABS9CBT8_9BACT|nr:glycosyltransferase family 2 protein [Xylanibacter brevis]MCF2562583.1 glycosyltransferase [Xylanibacter brevis]